MDSGNSGESGKSKEKESYRIEDISDFQVHFTDFIYVRQDKFFDYYERLEDVGEGTFGIVFKCRNRKSGQIRAVK